MYFLAERTPASRFLYNFPLYGEYALEKHREQLIADLERNVPRYFLVASHDTMPWVTGSQDDSFIAFLRFQLLFRWLVERYKLEAVIEDFVLYRLE